jgi:hypothetical protein
MAITSVPKKGLRSASRVVDGEAVVFHTLSGKVHVLNGVGSFIWQEIDGKRSAGDLVNMVCERYDVGRAEAEKDVLEFLQVLTIAEVLEA